MTKCVFTLLVFMILISSHLFSQDYDQFLYKHKIERYKHLSNTGRVFIGSGGILTAAGIISAGLLSQEKELSEIELKNRIIVSYIAVGAGIDLIIGGFIMKSIGAHKTEQYQEKLNNLSGGIIFSREC